MSSKWYKAIRPGTLVGGKFVKAGELFQLGPKDVFTDTWMEEHEAPAAALTPKPAEVKADQEKSVRDHEEQDKVRQGKFSIPSVPRSEAGEKAHQVKLAAATPPVAQKAPDRRA